MIILWDRPSGRQLKTNDLPETIAYGESLGWTQVKKKRAKKDSKGKGNANVS